jgi:prepilin-type N-terminal cleavage/methylation domain-containing protein
VTRRGRSLRCERGLSLVELMAALTVFAIITLGVTPLLISSIRGSAVSRSYTVGKNLVSEAMERARGLRFFQSVQGQSNPPRRDLLDLYYPNRGTGFSASGADANTFTTTCTSDSSTPSASAAAACPRNIPPGYTVEFRAAFVTPAATPPTPQTFTVQPPSANYNWSSTSTESPPTELLRLTVTSTWTYGGRQGSFSLTSLLGERHWSPQEITASGTIDYALQVLSAYQDSLGNPSNLVTTAGRSASDIGTAAIGEADQGTRAASMVLTEAASADGSAVTLADLTGAAVFVSAPPNSYPAPTASAGEQTLTYQFDLLTRLSVGFMDDTVVDGASPLSLGAQVVGGLPTAAGRFRFSGGAGQPSLWVDNQADRGSLSSLKLHASDPMVTLERGGSTRLSGQTSGVATALAPIASRKVETAASTQFGKLHVLPTTFISNASGDNSVIAIDNFTASLRCTSTADPATAAVSGSWSATLRYWRDPTNGVNLLSPPGYVEVPLSGSLAGGSDPLASLKASNPLVYDDTLLDLNDRYLFEAGGKKGYLKDLRSLPAISWTESSDGRSTSASLPGAIQIQTMPTSVTKPSTAITISIGKLSCNSGDRRGL